MVKMGENIMTNYDSDDYYVGYHGTSSMSAEDIKNGKIDVTLGGGELGQGFYLGDKLHVAKAWAKQRHDTETVVEIRTEEEKFYNFNILALDYPEVSEYKEKIRGMEETRNYKFDVDIVWSSIIGRVNLYADQYKWESKDGENFLNSEDVLRLIR